VSDLSFGNGVSAPAGYYYTPPIQQQMRTMQPRPGTDPTSYIYPQHNLNYPPHTGQQTFVGAVPVCYEFVFF
jgi:hypothetical protein